MKYYEHYRNQISRRSKELLTGNMLPEVVKPVARLKTNWWVFGISSLLILAVSLWSLFSPQLAASILGATVKQVTGSFGWFYSVTVTVIVIFMIVLAWAPSGHLRLGSDDSRPKYSLFSWGSMLFAAGIGIDLLFFSVAEPITHYYQPPTATPESVAAARQAVVYTIFHYGITGWALYALMGLAFALYAYRYQLPLAIRSALYPLFGRRINGLVGNTVDVAAMLGTVFGVATSLGIGVVQLSTGFKIMFGIPAGLGVQIGLIVLAVGTATISAVTGVDRGIKRLCELNVWLAFGLLAYIAITGKTAFLLNGLVMNIGEYFWSFPTLTMETYAYQMDRTWMQSWTLFFWAWWVAWAPFVGLFLARISKGRTLRQFIAGTLLVPTAFIALWISFFGNSALSYVTGVNAKLNWRVYLDQPELLFYELLSKYPAPTLVFTVAAVVGLLLFVTSANSAALVMSNFCSFIPDQEQDGPAWQRILWAILTGILTIAMLLVGGIPTLQSATILAGLPFALVIYFIMWGIYRMVSSELSVEPQKHS